MKDFLAGDAKLKKSATDQKRRENIRTGYYLKEKRREERDK
jgi:hypothetical protein